MTDFEKLHRDVVFGNSGGKIIWQPRIGCWFNDKIFSGEGLPEPYTGMEFYQLYDALNCSARLYDFNSCFRRIEHPSVKFSERRLNETDIEITISTPAGNQKAVSRSSKNSPERITLKWEVETDEELQAAIWREENTDWEWDQRQFDILHKNLCHLGAPTIFLPRMNLQSLYIEKMGVEKGIFALFQKPQLVEKYFAVLEESHDRLIDLVNASPIEIVNFGENIHAGTLPPKLFVKYHLPACQRRCEKLHSAGKFITSHWDGDVKPLLKYAQETGLDGIEAITPYPQGDVTLEEIKEALGDKMFLLDGIPAIYFDSIFPEELLIQTTERLIELFAPKLVLGISDEISSTGEIERIRTVGKIVGDFNR